MNHGVPGCIRISWQLRPRSLRRSHHQWRSFMEDLERPVVGMLGTPPYQGRTCWLLNWNVLQIEKKGILLQQDPKIYTGTCAAAASAWLCLAVLLHPAAASLDQTFDQVMDEMAAIRDAKVEETPAFSRQWQDMSVCINRYNIRIYGEIIDE